MRRASFDLTGLPPTPAELDRFEALQIHDLRATILHCLGIDHTQLTFRFKGRQYRLTDVQGDVVKAILA